MSGLPDTVECQICGESFDPDVSSGWCTNPECGEWQYDVDDGGGGGRDEEKVECSNCGTMVPDKDFCTQCGEDPTDQVDNESDPETGTESSHEPESAPTDQLECPDCKSDVQEDWEVCPHCSADLGSGSGGGTTQSQEVVVKVGDVEITATDGETIGKKVRSAYVRSGANEDDAQYIHREHVKFEQDGADFYVVNKGRNGTKLNGDELNMEERREVQDGDTIKFSGRATGEISLQ